MGTSKNTQRLAKKYFSIEEAEKILPRIERLVRRTVKLNRALDLLSSFEIEVYDDDNDDLRRITKLNKQFHKLSYEFYANIEKVEDLGCVIKDLDTGIVDFYSRFEGRDIFLCWKLGERQIKFWHEVDTCYIERKPIFDLSKR